MELASDITSEDLQAFLQEAEEHLQLLDEDIVRLEQEQDNEELLQEIFRAAHTLKGSSAMLGHQRMAELAHVMETLLDKVRKGTLRVNTQVADALLHGLDGLNMLKEELVVEDAEETDVTGVVRELEMAIEVENERNTSNQTSLEQATVTLSQENSERISLLQDSGLSIYQVNVSISQDSDWAVVRCFQVLEALSDVGEVLDSNPTNDDIAAERVGFNVSAILVADKQHEEIKGLLSRLDEVVGVEVEDYVHQERPEQQVTEQAESQDIASQHDVQTKQAAKTGQPQTVRIDVDRLDNMMNMIGELIIDRTRIVQISKALDSQYAEDDLVQALSKTSEHIVRVVDELQESTMQVRMQPIGTVFNGFPRMMRDLAQKIDKKVNFVADGQETEIDRTVIDRIRDPLVHLLRNSLDHGIESPEERVAGGKPEAGNIWLSAYHEQGHIVITVEDDGKGIDPQKLRDSVVSKGLMSSEAASRLTDAEALDLIFLPGASTAAKTTDISGRGVGMDIVKLNIEAINGFINVDTQIGQGTKFTLRLPLTLATLQALLVTLDGTYYAIPLVYVLETVVRTNDEISTVEGDKEVIRLRESVIPLIRLREVLGIEGDPYDDSQIWIVIARFGEKLVGIAVDELAELQEIVVKSLGRYIGDVKGIAGASVLGDGRVVLILDVVTLMNLIMQRTQSPQLV